MLEFYRNKRVFITGHTGFKGSWLSKILIMAGAEVGGFSQESNTNPALFKILNIENDMISNIGDIRDFEQLHNSISKFKPEIVFHLAAQPLVRESYDNPVYTYETNVIGTVNLLEAVRKCNSVKSLVNVTTDKVYENKEWEWGYRENERLNGFDPYSNSKSCSELITDSYSKCFFAGRDISISTVRAGNVIGGGDFSKDRIIPDCVKATVKSENIVVRNPNSVRPYQHVFEALNAYLILGEKQYIDRKLQGTYNVGPNEEGCVTTKYIVDYFCKTWGDTSWEVKRDYNSPHEANFLKLDCMKIKNKLSWKPKINIDKAMELTVEWYKKYYEKENIDEVSMRMIQEYFNKD